MHPCAQCTRSNLECAFPKPARQPGAASRARNTELGKRLAQLEQLVGNLGGQAAPTQEPTAAPTQEPTAAPQSAGRQEQGRLKTGTPEHTTGADAASSPSRDPEAGHADIERRTSNLTIREHERILKSGAPFLGSDFWANLSGEVMAPSSSLLPKPYRKPATDRRASSKGCGSSSTKLPTMKPTTTPRSRQGKASPGPACRKRGFPQNRRYSSAREVASAA